MDQHTTSNDGLTARPADPAAGATDDRLRAVLALMDAARQARASWWRDAELRDADARGRDDRSDRRDDLADERDRAALRRDADAAIREQAAADLAINAHERLDAQDAADIELVLAHTQAATDLAQIFTDLRALPSVPASTIDRARAAIELHLDRAYAAVLAIGMDRRQVRDDLGVIAQHLDAATADRLNGTDDRDEATALRQAARSDRGRAGADRQAAAIDRAR
jgi:hypothetical protein